MHKRTAIYFELFLNDDNKGNFHPLSDSHKSLSGRKTKPKKKKNQPETSTQRLRHHRRGFCYILINLIKAPLLSIPAMTSQVCSRPGKFPAGPNDSGLWVFHAPSSVPFLEHCPPPTHTPGGLLSSGLHLFQIHLPYRGPRLLSFKNLL